MSLIRNFLIFGFVLFSQHVDGGVFQQTANEPIEKIQIKRQLKPLFISNPFFNLVPTRAPQKLEQPQLLTTTLINSQAPIRVPLQQWTQSLPEKLYENNPFFLGPLPTQVETTTPVLTTRPPYVYNPFLNTQQVSMPTTTRKPFPASTTPSYVQNPFLTGHIESKPIQISTSTPTVNLNNPTNQVNTNNPFFQPTVANTWVQPITSAPAEIPRHPVQPEQSGQLRSFCAKARGQFPSGRCNTFVNCWDNVAVEQMCPPGLVFNYAGYCDYPQNVDCQGRSYEEILVPQPQPPITSSLIISENPQASKEVNQSAISSPATEIVANLPSTVFPSLPELTNTVPSIIYVPPPVDEKLKSKCLKPRGQFPSDVCNRYIDCWDDSIKEVECPEGLYFSEKGYCDYLFNVNCQDRTLNKAAGVIQSSSCLQPEGHFRDRNNCSRYLVCISNVVIGQHECPEGLYFNEMAGVCDYKHNVDCNRETFAYQPAQVANTVTKIPADVLSATKNCEPGKVFKLANDCSSAILCRKGMTEVVYCPSGLAYDAPTDRCLPQQLVKW